VRITPFIPVLALAASFLLQTLSAATIVTDQFSGFIVGETGLALHTGVVGEFTYDPVVVGSNGTVGLSGVTSFNIILNESSFAFNGPVVATAGLSDLTAISINPTDPNQLSLSVDLTSGGTSRFSIGPNPGQFLFPTSPEDAGLPLGFIGIDGYGVINQILTPALAPEPATWGMVSVGAVLVAMCFRRRKVLNLNQSFPVVE
jgi:PEP-CTERM motif